MASLVGKSIGNYQVVAQIGHGGMGAVYLGQHPMIGKRVAIKVLHEELAMKEDIVSRFFTEAKAVNDIQHPNIVDIVDFGKLASDDGKEIVYFIMEYLDGEGLNARLKREGASINDAVHIISQCASALAASHKKHIVHRDLKPENIYLVGRGSDRNYVKLLDFGIAKLTGDDASASKHHTRAGLVIGTPAYMSPEQCEGKGNIDWRSDVYSLGIVLFEMLTGRTPFQGDGFGEVLVAHLTKPPPVPSSIRHDLPPGIESVVMHALEKAKDQRFQSMEEFVAALADPNGHLAAYGSPSGRDASTAGTMMIDSSPQRTPSGAFPKVPTGQRQVTGPNPRITGAHRPITGQGQRHVTGEGQNPTAIAPGPTPTTLSGASGEVSGEAPRSRRGLLFGLIGGSIAAAGLAGYFVLLDKPVEQPKPTPVVQKPKQEFSTIAVDSQPKGAKAFRAGFAEAVGTTPFKLRVKRGEPRFDLLLKLDGFVDQTKSVSTESDQDVLIALAPKAAEVAPTPPPSPPPAPSKPSGSSHSGSASKHHDEGFKPVGEAPKKKDADGVLAPSF